MRTKQDVEAARKAINIMGGPVIASQKIREMSGKPCSRDRVQKWLINGIATPWHPIVHHLSGLPLHELDGDIYPSYLFS